MSHFEIFWEKSREYCSAMNHELYQDYLRILEEELVPALGCTEPIAVAYAAAKARETLGCFPQKMTAACSGNIIKNVKGVIVPTTGDLRGTRAAAILGAVGGDAARKLEVLTTVKPEHVERVRALLEEGLCEEKLLETPAKLHIIISMEGGGHSAMVEIIHSHTGIVRIEKDGQVLLDIPHDEEETDTARTDRTCLSIADILTFADQVDIKDVSDILDRQIEYNTQISKAGLEGDYGAAVGATLLSAYGNDIKVRARAAAAAGSDARMSGCEMPVVINSGSGNQGMTASLPVIEYAEELGATREKLYRALCVSNLVAIHQKTGIGKLSAYCGAVSAAAGAGAGITYLYGGSEEDVSKVIVNTLGNVSGIVCDGAKPSCAAKIASCVDAAILAMNMAMKDRFFRPGEGIVKSDVEATIASVGELARDGMRQTDTEILKIMVAD